VSRPSPVFSHVALSILVALSLVPAGPARAQNDAFVAVTVPFAAQSPTVPYDAVDGEPFYLPAVARGPCAQPIQFRWDTDGDGTWDTNLTNAPNRWNLGHSYTWPRQPASRVFTARVERTAVRSPARRRCRCGEREPQRGHAGERVIARALWWAHTQLTRDPNCRPRGGPGSTPRTRSPPPPSCPRPLGARPRGGWTRTRPLRRGCRWLVNFVLHRMTA